MRSSSSTAIVRRVYTTGEDDWGAFYCFERNEYLALRQIIFLRKPTNRERAALKARLITEVKKDKDAILFLDDLLEKAWMYDGLG